MTYDDTLMLASATALPSIVVVFIALCRLNAMQGSRVLFRYQLEYAVYVAIGFGSLCSPLIGEWPGMTQFGIMSGLAIILLCSQPAWRNDTAPKIVTEEVQS